MQGLLIGVLAAGCDETGARQFPRKEAVMKQLNNSAGPAEDRWQKYRDRMVTTQLASRDIHHSRVLDAMRRVPRHLFVPEGEQESAYEDFPLPIGQGQTISQPYIVALMTQEINPRPGMKVLEIGTGSGYQAAVLSVLVKQVFTIELLARLGEEAARRLGALGYANVSCRIGDGYQGWSEQAPFDAILVTAAAPEVPPRLVEQLAPGGCLIIPVGPEGGIQTLLRIEKDAAGKMRRSSLIPVRFVPLVKTDR